MSLVLRHLAFGAADEAVLHHPARNEREKRDKKTCYMKGVPRGTRRLDGSERLAFERRL